MFLSLLAVAAGLAVLILAADRLVVSAVILSRTLGLSPVLIGAVVVGAGTSVPELLVSAVAAGRGELDVAMANVVGSNVANVTLVLGAAAVAAAVVARRRILRREGVLMLIAVAGLAAVLVDGDVSRWEGVALLAGLLVALVLLIRWASRLNQAEIGEMAEPPRSLKMEVGIGTAALVATVLGAQLLLTGALDVADRLDWSATFVGLLLGVGTSLPELATALAAARRRQSELVVGNVLGSNLFNSLAVAGTAAVVRPGAITDLSAVVLAVMVLAAALAGLFAMTGRRLVRGEGAVLVGLFAVFSLLAF